jgi:hypothetical protein
MKQLYLVEIGRLQHEYSGASIVEILNHKHSVDYLGYLEDEFLVETDKQIEKITKDFKKRSKVVYKEPLICYIMVYKAKDYDNKQELVGLELFKVEGK